MVVGERLETQLKKQNLLLNYNTNIFSVDIEQKQHSNFKSMLKVEFSFLSYSNKFGLNVVRATLFLESSKLLLVVVYALCVLTTNIMITLSTIRLARLS